MQDPRDTSDLPETALSSKLAKLTGLIDRLKPFGSCDVADALSRVKHPAGGFLPGLIMHSPEYQAGSTKIIGLAHTVQFELNGEKGKKAEIKGHYVSFSQIDQTPSNHILFLNGPPGIPHAVYGGIMSARLQSLGVIGTIVSGRLRDINEQRDLHFPVWARGVGTTAGGEVCFPAEMNVPICVRNWTDGVEHSAVVSPGDVVVADADGVVVIPQELLERVVQIVPELYEADQRCLADVKGGRSVTDAFGEHRGKLRC